MSEKFKNFVLFCTSILGVVLLLEVGLRYFDDPIYTIPLSVQDSDLETFEVTLPDDLRLYAPKRNSKNTYEGKFGPYTITINEHGFRGDSFIDSEAVRVLAVGGSNTMGAMVNDNQTYPYLLEEYLNDLNVGKFQVFNLGVYAYNLRQKADHIKKYLELLKPHIIILQHSFNIGKRSFFYDYEKFNWFGDTIKNKRAKQFLRANFELYLENISFLRFCNKTCVEIIRGSHFVKFFATMISKISYSLEACGTFCPEYIEEVEKRNRLYMENYLSALVKTHKVFLFDPGLYYGDKKQVFNLKVIRPKYISIKKEELSDLAHPRPEVFIKEYLKPLADQILSLSNQ